MPYVDPATVHNPSTGGIATAAWGDTVRDDLEFLVAPPQCSFGHSTTQNVNTSTWTALAGNTENYDTDTMHSTVTNNSRATIVTAGKYDINILASYAADGAGLRSSRLLVNGSTSHELSNLPSVGAGAPTRINGSRTLVLAAADYVECQVWQNSGSTLACQLVEMTVRFVSR